MTDEKSLPATAISIKDLNISYENRVIFSHFDFEAAAGEAVGLFAPTGSGKTTLLNQIAQAYSDRKISYCFQEPRLIPSANALKNVMLPLENIFPKETARKNALEMLADLDLSALCNVRCKKLSGGEKQRVNLARAIAFPSEILLLDEPVFSQDSAHAALCLEKISTVLQERHCTAVIVSHRKEDLNFLCDRIVEL